MFIVILLLFILSFVFAYRQILRVRKDSNLILPPVYPGALPIFGHALSILGNTEYLWSKVETISQYCNEKGGILLFYLGTDKYYVVTDPSDFVTGANECWKKHFVFEFLNSWLGNGLVTAVVKPIWKRHRKLLNPAFSQQVVDGFIGVFNDHSKTLVNGMAKEVGKGPFDPTSSLDQKALESICRTAFGMNTSDDPTFDEKTYMKAAQEMLNIITKRLQNLFLHNDVIYKLSSLKRREDKVVKYLNDSSEAILLKKKESLKEHWRDRNGKKYQDFMDLILELSAEGTLENKEILEELNTIILAGYETTSSTLLFALVLLGSYPDIQEKVNKELLEVFGNSDRDVEKHDLSKLVYLDAVLKETLRVFAVTPVMMRCVNNDVNLKNYTMPAGSYCLLSVTGLHRHPIWGKDADLFRPERWLDPVAQADPDSAIHKAFSGFGVGSRLCLGRSFAMVSMKTTLAHVLRKYKVTADVTKLKIRVDPLLKASSGQLISVEYRKNN